MTVEQLSNLALSLLGVSNAIVDIATDNTREAASVRLWYDIRLRAFLELHPWATIRKYSELTLVRGPAWNTDPDVLTNVQEWSGLSTYAIGDVVRRLNLNYYAILASTNQQPPNVTYWVLVPDATTAQTPETANGDARYGYRYPTDCLEARRIVPTGALGTGRQFNAAPPTFFTGQDANGRLIFTSECGRLGPAETWLNPELEYSSLDCTHLWVNNLMVLAWAAFLAAGLAPELARNKKTAIDLLQEHNFYISRAQGLDRAESQQEKPGEADWVRNR